MMLLILLFILTSLLIIIRLRIKVRRNLRKIKKGTSIYPEYTAPDDISPAELGLLCDYRVNVDQLIATILYLKNRNYIEIEQTHKKNSIESGDYSLTDLGKDRGTLTSYEQSLMQGLFEHASTCSWREVRERSTYPTLLATFLYQVNQELQRKGYFFFYEGYDTESYEVAAAKMLKNPLQLVKNTIESYGQGYLRYATPKFTALWPHIEGFRQYLRSAEMDRIKFHTNPQNGISDYDDLLPFAIAIGLENKWESEFSGMILSE